MTRPAPPKTPSFVQPVLGLLAGLGISVLIVGAGSLLAALVLLRGGDARGLQTSPAFLGVTLALSVIGAFAGGYAAGRLTRGRSPYTVVLLAVVLLSSGLAPAIRANPAPTQPRWYMLSVAFLAPAAALLGGLMERRRRGPLPD